MERSKTPLRVGVGGARGRMGRAVIAALAAHGDLALGAAFDRDETGEGLATRDAALAGCDVIVDFSSGPGSAALARAAAERGGPPLVLGATGLSEAEQAAIDEAAGRIAIVQSGNFSIGVNLLAALVAEAARRLPAHDWDIEIVEAHHRRKVDAPSGTALMFGEAAAKGRGATLADLALPPRDGITGPRPAGGIGVASLRGGGIVGEHSVVFASDEEIITLSHSARDRALFARGALRAALWVVGKPPGLYRMDQVLGLGGTDGEPGPFSRVALADE